MKWKVPKNSKTFGTRNEFFSNIFNFNRCSGRGALFL